VRFIKILIFIILTIKKLFFQLNGIELGASVNRELKCRVRTIGATRGLTGHRPIVQNDIRLILNQIKNFNILILEMPQNWLFFWI
jgi:hypothetical protein